MSTPARAHLLPVAAIVSLLVLLLGATGLFTLSLTHTRAAAAVDRQNRLDAVRTTALETQVNFKTQVQEWKNILLRGHRPDDFARHLASFEQREAAVQAGLTSMKGQLAALNFTDTDVEALAAVHRTLGVDYRAALATWKREDPSGAFLVDAAVRGRDRQLGTDVDALAATAAKAAAHDVRVAAENAASLYAALRKAVFIIATLAVLAALWLVFLATRTARA
ncbi:MAG: histidine kinase [Rariglobus sp.]|jgi:hypothetical protein|nr:histidine kinase [Rariglobus sp.]